MHIIRCRVLQFLFILYSYVNITTGYTDNATISVSSNDLTVLVQEVKLISIALDGVLNKNINVSFQVQHANLIDIQPRTIEFAPDSDIRNATASIAGISPGHIEITVIAEPAGVVSTKNAFIRVLVAVSYNLITLSQVIGWSYFVAWSISFYPQVIVNFQRKSVTGLNFDYLALNILGFILYGIFNVGLYSIPEIQDEYSRRFPRGLNPVQLNDIFFAWHAAAATLITIIQCFIYDRADQRVSTFGRSILGVFITLVIVFAGLAIGQVTHWLDFLYYISYIKLCITLIKYLPQAYMNYQRKSTIGWSIGNVMLDFLGGWLSMCQMMINAYNYDDWQSLFGDPTKFGLGLFSVMFDILFLLQHYVFYRSNRYITIDGNNAETDTTNENAEIT